MNTLRDWHGDIEEFIDAKQKEEKKAWALIEQGYDGSYNGDAYGSVMYQNENLSVRASDEFMQAALMGKEWWTRSITSGKQLEKKDAAKLLYKIAEGTHICGDPGMQYATARSRNGTPAKAPSRFTPQIRAANTFSSNNTACNLASLNLMKFKREDGKFDIERFKAAVRIYITAQEILVDNASYPTKGHRGKFAYLPHARPWLCESRITLHELMVCLTTSDEGRALAGAINRHHDRHGLRTERGKIAGMSARFAGYRRCAMRGVLRRPWRRTTSSPLLGVVKLHRKAVEQIQPSAEFNYLKDEARKTWDQCACQGKQHG